MKRAARYKTGSIVFDKRRKTWNFLQWVEGSRRSNTIGTLQQFPTKGAAWQEAQRFLQTERLAAPQATTVPRRVVEIGTAANTMKDLIVRYESERLPSRKCTARTYRSWLNKHILPKWGETPIDEMQPRPVELWLRELALSPKSKFHIRNLLHVLMDFAMWSGALKIARNPMELVVVRGSTKRLRQPRSLTVDEFQKLSAHLKMPFDTMAMVCVCFGLRISECLGLRWNDVDWLGSKLRIERGVVEQAVDDVKTDASRKSMNIAKELLEVLRVWKHKSQFVGQDDWIFASPVKLGRQPYSYTGVWRELQRAGEESGVGRLGAHTFRHTYRSWLDAVGTTIAVQQKCMRHSDIRTTLNVYGDVITNEMAEASSKVAELAFKIC
jgi:integrase